MSKGFNGLKDRALIIAVTCFFIVFLACLALSYAMQNRLILSNGVSKAVASLDLQIAKSDVLQAQKTLATIKDGGQLAIAGQTYELPALDKYLFPDSYSFSNLENALWSNDYNAAQKEIDLLTQLSLNRSARQQTLSKTLHLISGVVLALLYFAIVLPLFRRKEEESDTSKTIAQENEGIMRTVSEGLFLLDKDNNIGVEQSASLKSIFKLTRDLDGNFFDFISNYVTQENVRIAQDYVQLLFGDRVKEKLVEDLNPLTNVEISLVQRDGQYEHRYLDFKFKRVLVDDKINHLLGSVTDVTKQVRLEKELLETREEQEAQVALLMSILHIDSKQLRGFLERSQSTLDNINARLQQRGHGDKEIRAKLLDILADAHQIKGDAAALGLHRFEYAAHEFEDELKTVKSSNTTLTGKQLLPAISKLRELFSEIDKTNGLVAQVAENVGQLTRTDVVATGASLESSEKSDSDDFSTGLSNTLSNLAQTVATRNDALVHFNGDGLKAVQIPPYLQDAVSSVLTQLVRNSVVHGYDGVAVREKNGKTPTMSITPSFSENKEGYQLVHHDDGKGIDWAAVSNKAVELNLIDEEQAGSIDKNQLAKLIFTPELSTLDDESLDGGRGVGLGVLMNLVREQNGSISIRSLAGRSCQFTVRFPRQEEE